MKLKNLFASDKEHFGRQPELSEEEAVCCGEHEVCEKEELLKAFHKQIEYYDDHELDAFIGKPSDAYTEEEAGLFADVLHTMWESDVPGWIRSLQLRGVELPDALKDEVYMLLNSH